MSGPVAAVAEAIGGRIHLDDIVLSSTLCASKLDVPKAGSPEKGKQRKATNFGGNYYHTKMCALYFTISPSC